ncbi:hypothetical protein AB4339_16580 [Vibrio breoganii]|uniref:hypothetical protein n=1 Tax=Vibrio breoganii TaxID=553239 RepID=UPI0010560DC1|nr:hypothetical protein [Vibrio breoganii]
MHYNSTTITPSNDGTNHLINIQAPSIAAYVPAYKLMTLDNSDTVKVETVVLEDVRGYDELFEHYEQEYQVAETFKEGKPWDYNILDAKSYVEMNDYHIQGLTKFKWLGNWPGVAAPVLQNISGSQMLILSQLETDITLCELSQIIDLPGNHDECLERYGLSDQWMKDWNTATIKAQQFARENNQSLNEFTWSGLDMATGFYRLRNADELAIEYGHTFEDYIPQYALVSKALSEMDVNILDEVGSEHPVGDAFKKEFGIIFTVAQMLYDRAPSNDFLIDRATGAVSDMSGTIYRPDYQ